MASFELLYPNYSRKCITFTIDDGNNKMDEKFLSIVRPAGIKGSFNLCSHSLSQYSPEYLRSFYEGYELTNHCKYHPMAMVDGVEYHIHSAEELESAVFCGKETELYPYPGVEGLYYVMTARGKRLMADNTAYLRLAEECHLELEEIFGRGAVNAYVWPFCEQKNHAVVEGIRAMGYRYGIRKTGCVLDSTDFAPPADINAWSYNADNRNLLSVMEKYESAKDNGSLRFFAFGVHSWDFERDGNWCDLEAFAGKYGSRPNDYWYATVGEIFEYLSAVSKLRVEGNHIVNDTDSDIYINYNGERHIVFANSEFNIQ